MLKTNPAFVDVLVASVMERLQHGRPVHLPGIGTLSVEHKPARMQADVGGRTVSEPREHVRFKPDQV